MSQTRTILAEMRLGTRPAHPIHEDGLDCSFCGDAPNCNYCTWVVRMLPGERMANGQFPHDFELKFVNAFCLKHNKK